MYNPETRYDIFAISRGIIAGSIMVSAPASQYKLWIALIIGALGGALTISTS